MHISSNISVEKYSLTIQLKEEKSLIIKTFRSQRKKIWNTILNVNAIILYKSSYIILQK
jgi:hypothetical protein